MADWQTVRYDPTYVEPLDPEIIPLCDALNAAGFVTDTSCWGHCFHWPKVWFKHSSDERIEALARFIIGRVQFDDCPYYLRIQKEIRIDDYLWSIEIHCNNIFGNTPAAITREAYLGGLSVVTALVEEWASSNPRVC